MDDMDAQREALKKGLDLMQFAWWVDLCGGEEGVVAGERKGRERRKKEGSGKCRGEGGEGKARKIERKIEGKSKRK